MGVLNVTPDSFSDGGRFFDPARATGQALAMIAAGADIVDVGGESTRPGAATVDADEERRRVTPVIDAIRRAGSDVLISVDTTKASVAEAALAAGAHIVNDISALRFDERMTAVARDSGAGVVLMHMRGTPQTMQQEPAYKDVVGEVRAFLEDRIEAAVAAGIDRTQIAVDPGIGFGKTVAHNMALLARLDTFRDLGCPMIVGTSRKSFIGHVLDRKDPADRVWGTAATVAWSVSHGARVVRVHDVAAMRDVARMTDALLKERAV
jgi:dihydropteroate synthase